MNGFSLTKFGTQHDPVICLVLVQGRVCCIGLRATLNRTKPVQIVVCFVVVIRVVRESRRILQ